jgi:tetrahydromethanopterin S-methyltransferase subunit G
MSETDVRIPDDLTSCQEQLRAALERLGDLERQLDETCATTEELQRAGFDRGLM